MTIRKYCKVCEKMVDKAPEGCPDCGTEWSGAPRRIYKPDRSFEKPIREAYEKAEKEQKYVNPDGSTRVGREPTG